MVSAEDVLVDLLVFAPHPDDAELGMGATIAKFIAAGTELAVVELTNGEPTPFGSPELRAKEAQQASQVLGIRHRELLGLPNRDLVASLEKEGVTAHEEGDSLSAIEQAHQQVQAEYHLPYLSHAPMEPLNCTAHVQADR